jgi:hypothetical protein
VGYHAESCESTDAAAWGEGEVKTIGLSRNVHLRGEKKIFKQLMI